MRQKLLAIIASIAVGAAVIAAVILVSLTPRAMEPVTNAPVANIPVVPPDTAHDDLIRLDSPRPNDEIASPLTVTGEARGNWYFEASFPIRLLDGDGTMIAEHYATAQGEWMTAEFVPFVGVIEFERPPATKSGTLVLMKDNASGLPEFDDEIRIPVRFAAPVAGQPWKACKRSGCSGQICADEEMASDCMFRPEYACYQGATCERQADGECGWTETPALTACLQDPPAVE